MKELVEKINAEFEVFAANAAAQVEKGNKAAGTRARKSALEISKLMKEFRKVSVEAAEEYGLGYNLVAGANIAGFKKVATAMMEQGIF